MKFLKKNYKDCWKFFKEARDYIIVALIIFMIFAIVGFLFPIFFQEKIFEIIQGLVEMFEGRTAISTILLILLNNVRASFLSMILGLLAGIFPLVTAIINGYLIGFVVNYTIRQEGIFILWKLVPHGIFELPAIIMSIGIGFKLGLSLFKPETVKENLIQAMRFFVFVVLPLLLIASIIEGILVFVVG